MKTVTEQHTAEAGCPPSGGPRMDNMKTTFDRLVAEAGRSHIGSISTVLHRITDVMGNAKSSTMDLKCAIEVDPPLSARVLRRANSAFYGARKEITDILEAIIYIGFDAVKELALSQKVFELFDDDFEVIGDDKEEHGYSRKSLWIHCLAVSLCSKLIFRQVLRRKGDDVATIGLLHDIGILVEDQFLHDEFGEVLKRQVAAGVNLHDAEITVLGFNHVELGQRLVKEWKLPKVFSDSIGVAEHPHIAAADNSPMAQALYIAHYGCCSRRLGYVEFSSMDKELYRQCLNGLNMEDDSLRLIMEDVEKQIRQMEKNGWL